MEIKWWGGACALTDGVAELDTILVGHGDTHREVLRGGALGRGEAARLIDVPAQMYRHSHHGSQ